MHMHKTLRQSLPVGWEEGKIDESRTEPIFYLSEI
jgi:hypothetical protein